MHWIASWNLRRRIEQNCDAHRIYDLFHERNFNLLAKSSVENIIIDSWKIAWFKRIKQATAVTKLYKSHNLPYVFQTELPKNTYKNLPIGELNPGLPSDRRGYSPHYTNEDFLIFINIRWHRYRLFNKFLQKLRIYYFKKRFFYGARKTNDF